MSDTTRQQIIQTSPGTAGSIPSLSRYTRCAKVYRDLNTDDLKLDYQRATIGPDESDTVVEVLPGEAWRPDLLAARVYGGKHQLAWVLQVFNSMFHVRDFQAGTAVRVPSMIRLRGSLL